MESKEVKRWNVEIDDHSTSWQRNFIEHADTVYNSHLQFMKYRDIRLNLSKISTENSSTDLKQSNIQQ